MTKKHNCEDDLPFDGYGIAIDSCNENEDGSFWVANGEYGSAVNYCPFCGKKAPRQIDQAFKDESLSKRQAREEKRFKEQKRDEEGSLAWRISTQGLRPL